MTTIKIFLALAVSFGLGLMAIGQRAPQSNVEMVEVKTSLFVEKFDREPIRVAVIDTGFDFKSNWSHANMALPKLCKEGHTDFSGLGLQDNHGHGTHIAGLIGQNLADVDYCLVILKFYNGDHDGLLQLNSNKAIMKAIDLKVDVINYSGGGTEFEEAECRMIKYALDKGIKVVAAAGNQYSDINKNPFYPAMCDERVMIVGNINQKGERVPSSNYSLNNVGDRWLFQEPGFASKSIYLHNTIGYLTGSSQSTAVMSGKVVRWISNQRINWKQYFYQALPEKSIDS